LWYVHEIEKANIKIGFLKLLGLRNVIVEDPDSITQAISWYKNKVDFAGVLHFNRNDYTLILD
jgi:hypothetical protein